MEKEYSADELEQIQAELATLPIGYISRKKISGKDYFYRQWSEDGKTKSQYIKKKDLDTVRSQIARRKELQGIIKKSSGIAMKQITRGKKPEFETNVLTGALLEKLIAGGKAYRQRAAAGKLAAYLLDTLDFRICLLLGLRKTGKTTLMHQALYRLGQVERARAAYIRLTDLDTRESLLSDVKRLAMIGMRYVMIDEMPMWDSFGVTLEEISDVYGNMGMKIAVSVTNVSEAVKAVRKELFDRVITIETTYLSYGEYNRLFFGATAEQYLRLGGIMQNGFLWGNDADIPLPESQFVQTYIDQVICRDVGQERAGFIREQIYRINEELIISIFSRDFKLYDWRGMAEQRRAPVQDESDTAIGFLRDAALYREYECRRLREDRPAEKYGVFMLPWIRYSQAQALLEAFLEDKYFAGLSERDKRFIHDRVLKEAEEHMLTELVLFETERARGGEVSVCLFYPENAWGQCAGSVLVYDSRANECWLYVVMAEPEPGSLPGWLTDGECRQMITEKYGRLIDCCILYSGEEKWLENDIHFMNLEEYLRRICI